MPHFGATTRAFGDVGTGHGYGTLRDPSKDADKTGEEIWPYREKTDLEAQADREEDKVGDSRKAINKKKKRARGVDTLAQLNYHTGAYVNGSTRGLTGIMSGMDPMAVLEQLVRDVEPLSERGAKVVRSTFGRKLLKPIGQGAYGPPTAMNTDPTTRLRPGRRTGSKQGWFSPPPPKDSDPVNSEHAYSLQDIARNKDDRALRNADIETQRVKRKNAANERKNVVLRAYVRLIEGET